MAGRSKTAGDGSVSRLYRFAGIAAAVACGGYFIAVGVEHAAAFPALRWNGAAVAALVAASLLFMATMVIAGFAWHVALRAAGEPPRLWAAVAAVLLSQVAKYVPGNFAHVIGRAALARRYGFALPRVILAMTFESGWILVTATLVAVAALLVEGPRLSAALPELPAAWIAVVLAAALAAPAAGAWVLGRWRPGPLARLLGNAAVALPGVAPTLACIALYCANFALAGLALDLIAQGPLAAPESRFVLLTGIFAVAWVVGYVTPGAPGGLGVREAILVVALGPVYGAGTAFALALVLRVCTFAADGIGFLAGLAIRRSIARS